MRNAPRVYASPRVQGFAGAHYPRYRHRYPGFTYYYGGWWYAYPWWLESGPYHYGDYCDYWSAVCASQWGYDAGYDSLCAITVAIEMPPPSHR